MAANEEPKVEGETALAHVPPVDETPITTAAHFSVEIEKVFARAKKGGLNPQQMIAATYFGRVKSVVGDLLDALGGSN